MDETQYCVRCGNSLFHPIHQGPGEDLHLFTPPDTPPLADAAAEPHDEPEGVRGKTWEPIDLGPILRGEHKPAEPSVGLMRSDGLQLLYPGKEHTVIGEMECGKSWLSTSCCVAEITAGYHVVYVHFEETDPADTVGRLQALGASDEAIIAFFHFIGPEEPVETYMLGPLLELAPTLVVLDGVNEAMSLHGQGIRDEDGAAAFRRKLIKPFTAAGAATLAADHVVKDREQRGRSPIGSVHKGNAVNGSLIMMENTAPFGRGQHGRSQVYVVKDRPGHLRKHGQATQLPGKTFMGTLAVDDTRERHDYLDLTFWAPKPPDESGALVTLTKEEADELEVLRIVGELTVDGPQALAKIRAKAPIANSRTADALERLVIDKKVVETRGVRGARLFAPATCSSGPPSIEGGHAQNRSEGTCSGTAQNRSEQVDSKTVLTSNDVSGTCSGTCSGTGDESHDATCSGTCSETPTCSGSPEQVVSGVYGPGEWAAAGHPGI